MATTQFNNRLITPELTEALSSYPLYSQDAKKKDALCIAVFYLGNIRWYIMEWHRYWTARDGVRLPVCNRNGKYHL